MISQEIIHKIQSFQHTPKGAGIGGYSTVVTLFLRKNNVKNMENLTEEQGQQLLQTCQRLFSDDKQKIINGFVQYEKKRLQKK